MIDEGASHHGGLNVRMLWSTRSVETSADIRKHIRPARVLSLERNICLQVERIVQSIACMFLSQGSAHDVDSHGCPCRLISQSQRSVIKGKGRRSEDQEEIAMWERLWKLRSRRIRVENWFSFRSVSLCFIKQANICCAAIISATESLKSHRLTDTWERTAYVTHLQSHCGLRIIPLKQWNAGESAKSDALQATMMVILQNRAKQYGQNQTSWFVRPNTPIMI